MGLKGLRSVSVEWNPGPKGRALSFATWNIDSLLARDGTKIYLIESVDTLHKFDMFGICESYLTENISNYLLGVKGFPPVPERSDCKARGKAQGGACLYYKYHLSLKRRHDLETLDESIVVEINLNRKKILFLLAYRSPSQNSLEYQNFMENLTTFYDKASLENPSTIIITGDFNARS